MTVLTLFSHSKYYSSKMWIASVGLLEELWEETVTKLGSMWRCRLNQIPSKNTSFIIHIFPERKEAVVYPTSMKVYPQKVSLAKWVNAHLWQVFCMFCLESILCRTINLKGSSTCGKED